MAPAPHGRPACTGDGSPEKNSPTVGSRSMRRRRTCASWRKLPGNVFQESRRRARAAGRPRSVNLPEYVGTNRPGEYAVSRPVFDGGAGILASLGRTADKNRRTARDGDATPRWGGVKLKSTGKRSASRRATIDARRGARLASCAHVSGSSFIHSDCDIHSRPRQLALTHSFS